MRLEATIALVVPLMGMPAVAAPFDLMSGEVQRAVVTTNFGASCYVDRGFTTYAGVVVPSVAPNNRSVISFDEISYPVSITDPVRGTESSSRDLRGGAVMTFTSGNAGNIRFKITATYPNGTLTVPFNNYTYYFNTAASQIVINFEIAFPGCTLPIVAVYEGQF